MRSEALKLRDTIIFDGYDQKDERVLMDVTEAAAACRSIQRLINEKSPDL